MNARQAAKAAAKHIEDLEYLAAMNKADIVDYVKCIQHMIRHGSPCDFCEDLEECKAAEKDVTLGCDDWMLRFQDPDTITPVDPFGPIEEPKDGEPDEQEARGNNVPIFGVEEQ